MGAGMERVESPWTEGGSADSRHHTQLPGSPFVCRLHPQDAPPAPPGCGRRRRDSQRKGGRDRTSAEVIHAQMSLLAVNSLTC